MLKPRLPSQRRQLSLTLLLLLFGCGGGPSQARGKDVAVLSFRDYLQKVLELRSEIKSYDLTVMGIVRNAPGAGVATDGKAHIAERIPRRFTLEMAVDNEQHIHAVARKEWYTQVSPENAYETEEKVSPWLLNIRVGDWEVVCHDNREAVARAWREPNRFREPKQFDPLALGLAMGEYTIGGDLRTIVANYSQHAGGFAAAAAKDRLVQYGATNSWQQLVDPSRGYWPVSLKYEDARTRNSFDLTIEQVHGEWLPVAVHVITPTENTDLELQWHSVNQPLPNDRFSLDGIKKRYDCTIHDRRVD